MPRRRRDDVVTGLLAALVAALGLGAGACEADPGDAGCQLTLQVTLAGTPLTLISDARIDQVGGGFFLLGSDGSNLRWAPLRADGTLGSQQAFPLPSGVTSAYYAVAGLQTPGDTVLLATLGTDATGANGELAVIALPADGSPPPSPATTIENFSGFVPDASSVVMSSSRAGMNAGLAWVDSASGQVKFTTVSGAGMPGATVVTSTAGPPFSCLAFSPGKDDLTIKYYGGTTSLGTAGWVIAEANEEGSLDSTTVLAFPGQMLNCATVTPTSTGYALVWQDKQGGWLAEYVTQGQTLSAPYPFVSASDFGGASLQPPIVGLAPFGTDFGVLFARPLDVELWRLGDKGERRTGALIFPSVNGTFGSVSALPVGATLTPGGPLAVTYADYISPVGVTPMTGGRLFANAVCY